jgi:hypothetical protein
MIGRALIAALLLGAGAVGAEPCRLALVLALDVSSSVDAAEDRLQREGLARALLDPQVTAAVLAGEPVAFYVFEWSGRSAQRPLAPGWNVIRSEDDLHRLAARIEGSQRGRSDLGTALGAALGHAAAAFAAGPECRARTIDVSGDGIGNEGPEPRAAYRAHPLLGEVTVNALVIGGERAGSQLVAWFAEEVIRGEGAFWMHATDYEAYGEAMRIKLLRELEVPVVGKAPRGTAR